MRSRYLWYTVWILVGVWGTVGCTKVGEQGEQAQAQVSLGREDPDITVVVAIDLSGSFAARMLESGEAYKFLMRVLDTYFRNSIGTNNRIVIAQLSAAHTRSLLWDGTPLQLRQDLPTATAFRDYLHQKSNPSGSRLHDGIADCIDYICSEPSIANGKTRTVLLALTDMWDNAPAQEASEKRLVQALTTYSKTKGLVGMYFLDHAKVPIWRKHLRDAGVKSWVCESAIVAHPSLPTFD